MTSRWRLRMKDAKWSVRSPKIWPTPPHRLNDAFVWNNRIMTPWLANVTSWYYWLDYITVCLASFVVFFLKCSCINMPDYSLSVFIFSCSQERWTAESGGGFCLRSYQRGLLSRLLKTRSCQVAYVDWLWHTRTGYFADLFWLMARICADLWSQTTREMSISDRQVAFYQINPADCVRCRLPITEQLNLSYIFIECWVIMRWL